MLSPYRHHSSVDCIHHDLDRGVAQIPRPDLPLRVVMREAYEVRKYIRVFHVVEGDPFATSLAQSVGTQELVKGHLGTCHVWPEATASGLPDDYAPLTEPYSCLMTADPTEAAYDGYAADVERVMRSRGFQVRGTGAIE